MNSHHLMSQLDLEMAAMCLTQLKPDFIPHFHRYGAPVFACIATLWQFYKL